MEWPMPVRSIRKSYRNVTGIVNGDKSIGRGAFESTLEKDLYNQLNFAVRVERFEVQAVKVTPFGPDCEFNSYTPDTLIFYRNDLTPYKFWPPRLIEVKYRSDLKDNWDELKPKFKAAHKYAKNEGWDFKILTEVEIRTPFWENVKFLSLNKNINIPYEIFERFLTAIETLEKTTPYGLLEHLKVNLEDRGSALAHMWHMIANLHIATDLSLPLTMASPIWVVKHDEDIFHDQNQLKPYPW